jgi:hypothetical protein
MLLIGWSGSYTYLAVQRYWGVDLAPPIASRRDTDPSPSPTGNRHVDRS